MQLMRTVYSATDGEFGSVQDNHETNFFDFNSTEEVYQIDRDVNKEINDALR